MKILGVIPARGGSKGVPGKNIKLLEDKPLICYSIEAALASTGGHRAKAAAMLGISRYTLYKKLREPEESETSSASPSL